MPDRQYWEERLTESFRARWPDYTDSLRLPSGIGFHGRAAEVEMVLRLEHIAEANMQEDPAAFEAWAVALRGWGGADQVTIRWDGDIPATPHGWRFRYRAGHFARIFNRWFRVATAFPSALANDVEYFINVESDPRTAPPLPPFSTDLRESELEVLLAHDPEISAIFRSSFGLKHVGRQLPVGVFAGEVSQIAAVAPGRKSAIDLWGLDDASISIFELKTWGNDSLGILSELFFYGMVMRDLQAERFKFDPHGDLEAPYRAIPRRRDVRAWLLAPTFHSMLGRSDRVLLDVLNTGFLESNEPIRFHRAHIGAGPRFTLQH